MNAYFRYTLVNGFTVTEIPLLGRHTGCDEQCGLFPFCLSVWQARYQTPRNGEKYSYSILYRTGYKKTRDILNWIQGSQIVEIALLEDHIAGVFNVTNSKFLGYTMPGFAHF